MRRNKPSYTAREIARYFLYMVQDPVVASLAPRGSVDVALQLLLATGTWKPWMQSLISTRWYRGFVDRILEPMMPGHLLHVVMRKRFFDDEVRTAITEGVRQVLVIGGGYDTLCLRQAAEYPDVAFFEIDHPATHHVKSRAVAEINASSPNLALIGVDLGASSLAEVLLDSKDWNPTQPTAVVAEGVLMYLDDKEVASFFEAIRDSTPPGSRILFSYLHEGALKAATGRLGFLVDLSLRLSGEPLKWEVKPGEIGAFLEALEYRYEDDPPRYDLRKRYLEPIGESGRPLGHLENLAACHTLT